LNLKKSESEDPDFDPNFDSILDIRHVENAFSKEIRDDLENYLGIIKSIQHVTQKRRSAVVTERPAQVAGITWYQMIDDRGIDYEVFSTLKAAIKWLGIGEIDLKNIDPDLTDIQ
jgi:hypothetical protein